ncbi:hypothetical protein ACHAW5_006676 [Stephanodiscus triporus]|uniref:DUF6787 domain-containing protein n=1 Tax=Stephanodiscus triporus TaxID=2934178 RepID=A0ABD3MN58_9STRA
MLFATTASPLLLHRVRSGLSSHSSLLLQTHGGLGGLGGRSACRTSRRRWFGLGAGDTNSNNNNNKHNNDCGDDNDGAPTSLLRRFLAPKVMPPRNTARWYAEMALLCAVFGITGTSTMFLVRPAVSDVLGLEGSMKDGPWSYRICSLFIMTPVYPIILVIVGTVFGRHAYFRHFSVKMFSRFGIPPEMMDAKFAENARHFRKW